MTDRLQGTDHSACPHVGARSLRWSAVVVSRGLRASAVDSTSHTRSTQTKPAAAVCAILGASLLAVGAVLMKPVESSGISARIDGANGSIDPHQELNIEDVAPIPDSRRPWRTRCNTDRTRFRGERAGVGRAMARGGRGEWALV